MIERKTIGILGIVILSIIGASILVFAAKPGSPSPELTVKTVPVFLFAEFQPGETRSSTIELEGYTDVIITYNYPPLFLMEYSWGCEDTGSGQIAESLIFEIKPSAQVTGTHSLEVAGSKLIIDVANQDVVPGTLHLWLYVIP
jgi:hypothetical protein